MATEKLRAELEILTAKAEKDLKRFDRSLAGVERRITSMGGRGGKSLKPLGEGLSAATVNANEFEKSMAAANARVIAFGASAGLILQVQRALKETVRATIEVEKSLTDINVVLNTNTKGLQKFGDSLFKIAGQTGQGFKTVAVAATELARQGLGMEQTLKRTSDALILTRLTGMQAEEAVSSLTAAVNSFSKAGITSAQVINKMAKVDQAFAVSSDDLAKAISRVGSSAVDAGVSMDELLAITTAVQQRTARGGAVIGNAFKTIFTRIGRTDVQKKLSDIGVATRDMQGQMLPATRVLENLSTKFQDLSKSQQNQIAESVAGVFQVNILRAALGDLSSKYGVYNRALRESATATNEAYLKNQQLNQTLDALVNRTLANLTKAGSAIGGATLKPAIENVLNLVNSAIGAFGEGGRFEEFGKGIGKDIMTGIGNFLAGPGLVVVTAGIGKLAFSFAKFAGDALKGFADIGRQAANRKALEAQITAELQRQPNIIRQIERGELSAASAARDMLASMKASNLEATKLAVTTSRISASMMGMGALRRPGRAQGFIPNFADPNAERASAAMGGYKAGAIKTMNIPGQGNVMYNGAETVKQFPGMVQPAIMPPQRSLAGANYKKSFSAAHGFDPYAAGGFVPNFDLGSMESKKGQTKGYSLSGAIAARDRFGRPMFNQAALSSGFGAANVKKFQGGGQAAQIGKDYTYNASTLGLLGLEGTHSGTSTTSLGQLAKFKEAAASGRMDKRLLNRKVTFTNMQKQSISSIKRGMSKQEFSNEISRRLVDPVAGLSSMIFKKALGNNFATTKDELARNFGNNTQLLPPGAEGSIFEAAINLGILTNKRSQKARLATFDQSRAAAQKPFDFEETGKAKPSFIEAFGFGRNLMFADAKRTIDNDSMRTLIKKAYNQGIPGLPGLELLTGGASIARGSGRRGRALGHVPNFSPLGDAITRERAAGVPRSAIRVGASASLKSAGNPAGLGVYNTIDEPAGLHQGISRSRSMGINPKGHGIPNFRPPLKLRTGTSMPAAGAMGPGPRPASPVEKAKDRAATEKFDRGSGKLEEAAETLNEASVGFTKSTAVIMGLSSMAYMAMPMMERAGMGQETQGRMSSALMFANLAALMPRGGGPSVLKRAGASGIKSFSKGAAGRGLGTKLLDAGRAGGKALGRGLIKPGVGNLAKKVAAPVAIGAGIYDFATGAITGFKETPEEKAARELQAELAAFQEGAARPGIESAVGQISAFAGGFGGATGATRSAGFSSIRNTLFGEDGTASKLKGENLERFNKAFLKFTNSFGKGSNAVQEASDDLTAVLGEIAEEETKAETAIKARKSAQDLQKLTKSTMRDTPFLAKAAAFVPSLFGGPDIKDTFQTAGPLRKEIKGRPGTHDPEVILPPSFATGVDAIPGAIDDAKVDKFVDSLVELMPGGILGGNQRIAARMNKAASLGISQMTGIGPHMMGGMGLPDEIMSVVQGLDPKARSAVMQDLRDRGYGDPTTVSIARSTPEDALKRRTGVSGLLDIQKSAAITSALNREKEDFLFSENEIKLA